MNSPITCRIGRHAVLHRFPQRRLGHLLGLAQLGELRGVVQAQPDVEADQTQRSGDQERDAPAVALHRVGGQQCLQQRDGHRADQESEDTGPRHERDGQAAALLGRELGEIDRAAAVFAAGREALQTTQEEQQQRCGDADRGVGRQQADGERRARHQQDHQREHALPSDPVAERSEHEPAEGPHEERGREDRERLQQRRGFVAGREEVGGDERGQEPVDGEVEPFDGVADRRTDDCLRTSVSRRFARPGYFPSLRSPRMAAIAILPKISVPLSISLTEAQVTP